jgi:hypothetical protein
MRATLSFNLPEEQEEFKLAVDAAKYSCMWDDVWSRIFRPRHKHMYNNPVINKLLELEECHQLMDELEKIHQEIREEYLND